MGFWIKTPWQKKKISYRVLKNLRQNSIYYLKIYLTNNNLCVNNLFKPEWQNFDINKLGHLRSSVTVEEIVLPDFNKDNIESLEMTDLVPDIG